MPFPIGSNEEFKAAVDGLVNAKGLGFFDSWMTGTLFGKCIMLGGNQRTTRGRS